MTYEEIRSLLMAASMAFHRLEQEGIELTEEEDRAWMQITIWLET